MAATDRKKVLILSHDKIGAKMAGVGIRYHYMAVVLAQKFDVTLGVFNPKYLDDEAFDTRYKAISVPIHDFKAAFDEADYIISLWLSPEMLAYAIEHNKYIVFDIYAPVPVEIMAQMLFSHRTMTEAEDREMDSTIRRYADYLRYGNLLLVSNERQLDFWVGFGFAACNVRPTNFDITDPFRRLAIAPMGIDISQPLEHTRNALRGVVGSITQDDFVLVWTGGLWDWFDAQIIIRAMAKLQDKPHIKFVFLGTQHPNDEIPVMAETVQTRKLAKELGVLDKTVYFLDGWMGYADRVNYLLEADVAVYAHKPSIEARYSHRTRVIDSHIFASLPTIATAGDYFADEIARHDMGVVVEPGDTDAFAAAIERFTDPAVLARFKQNVAKVRPSYDWNVVLAPLVDFIGQTDPATKVPVVMDPPEPLVKPFLYRAAQRYLPQRTKETIKRVRKKMRRR